MSFCRGKTLDCFTEHSTEDTRCFTTVVKERYCCKSNIQRLLRVVVDVSDIFELDSQRDNRVRSCLCL